MQPPAWTAERQRQTQSTHRCITKGKPTLRHATNSTPQQGLINRQPTSRPGSTAAGLYQLYLGRPLSCCLHLDDSPVLPNPLNQFQDPAGLQQGCKCTLLSHFQTQIQGLSALCFARAWPAKRTTSCLCKVPGHCWLAAGQPSYQQSSESDQHLSFVVANILGISMLFSLTQQSLHRLCASAGLLSAWLYPAFTV